MNINSDIIIEIFIYLSLAGYLALPASQREHNNAYIKLVELATKASSLIYLIE